LHIAIVGAKGFVGSALVKEFEKKGITTTSIDRSDTVSKETLLPKLKGADIIINLAGAPIINRWSEEYKKLLYSSRIKTTNLIVECISELEEKPELFISTSAVGRYKEGGLFSEYDDSYADNFLGQICKDWEESALKARELTRVVIFRFAVIIGKGGMMNKVLPPFKLGVGGIIGDGKQGFSWVSLTDIVKAMEFVIDKKSCEGVYNLSSPNPTDNHGFTKTLGELLHRPTLFPLPSFVVKLLYGEGSTVLLDGQRVIPKRLLEEGFVFTDSELKDALKKAIG